MNTIPIKVAFTPLIDPLVPKDFSHSSLPLSRVCPRHSPIDCVLGSDTGSNTWTPVNDTIDFILRVRSFVLRVSAMTESSFGKMISIKSGNGDDIASNPVVRNSFTYTGREWESEVDMFYYRARWYSPTIGRFLQSDPEPGSVGRPSSFLNKYLYAENNPIKFIDPLGKGILEVFGVILTAFVSIVSGLWVGQLFAGLGTFWGGVLGGLAGSIVGSQLGGVIMGLAYQGEGRNYSDGQKIGMQIGGFLGGMFGAQAGSGNMSMDDFWNSFSSNAHNIAMSDCVKGAIAGVVTGAAAGIGYGLSLITHPAARVGSVLSYGVASISTAKGIGYGIGCGKEYLNADVIGRTAEHKIEIDEFKFDFINNPDKKKSSEVSQQNLNNIYIKLSFVETNGG